MQKTYKHGLAAWWSAFASSASAQEVTQQLDKAASASTKFWSGWAAVFGFFSINQWAAIIGIILGIASFFLSWHFKKKNHQLIASLVKSGKMSELIDELDQ